MTHVPDNRMFIVCARHDLARDWAKARLYPDGSFKTITRASSLLGLNKHAKVLYLDTGLEFPEALAIQRELRTRFTNVVTIHHRIAGLQPEAGAENAKS